MRQTGETSGERSLSKGCLPERKLCPYQLTGTRQMREQTMINFTEVSETNKMIDQENLDVRTITMGISLLDCADADLDRLCRKIHDKIVRSAQNLVKTGEEISADFGIPIVNKRISVTPISLVPPVTVLRIMCA